MTSLATNAAPARGEPIAYGIRAWFQPSRWRHRLAVSSTLCLLSLTAHAERVKVAGSDLLGRDFEAALQAFAQREKLPVEVAFQGSRAGIDALKTGATDLAIVSLAPDEKLPADSFVASPLAYRIAVVVAPQAIPATQISFTQLDGFFGASGPAGYTSWRDLGVTGQAAPLTVATHLLATRTDSLAVDIFTHAALREPRLKSSVTRHTKLESIKEKLATEEGGLAILPMLPGPAVGLRVLSISKGEGEPAFGPTPENIHTGDYPLRLPVFVVYRKEPGPALRELLKFLWSEAAADALSRGSSCVPVPPSGRPLLR
jgi:ABC-type phosphate transport system substrate-binding protein